MLKLSELHRLINTSSEPTWSQLGQKRFQNKMNVTVKSAHIDSGSSGSGSVLWAADIQDSDPVDSGLCVCIIDAAAHTVRWTEVDHIISVLLLRSLDLIKSKSAIFTSRM